MTGVHEWTCRDLGVGENMFQGTVGNELLNLNVRTDMMEMVNCLTGRRQQWDMDFVTDDHWSDIVAALGASDRWDRWAIVTGDGTIYWFHPDGTVTSQNVHEPIFPRVVDARMEIDGTIIVCHTSNVSDESPEIDAITVVEPSGHVAASLYGGGYIVSASHGRIARFNTSNAITISVNGTEQTLTTLTTGPNVVGLLMLEHHLIVTTTTHVCAFKQIDGQFVFETSLDRSIPIPRVSDSNHFYFCHDGHVVVMSAADLQEIKRVDVQQECTQARLLTDGSLVVTTMNSVLVFSH